MQEFREKYSYKVSLYFTIFTIISFILPFVINQLITIFAALSVALFLVITSILLRFFSSDMFKRWKDIAYLLLGPLLAMFVYFFQWMMVSFLCINKTDYDLIMYDCSNIILGNFLNALLSHILTLLPIFILLGFIVSLIFSVKYLVELKRRSAQVL